jgi:hypothetical protein
VGFGRLKKIPIYSIYFLYIDNLYVVNLHSQSQKLGLFKNKVLTPSPVTKAVITSYLYGKKHSFCWGIATLLMFSFLWKTVTAFTMQAKYTLS